MDRTTVQVARAQIGFLDVIIQPPFECLVKVIPKMSIVLEYAEKTKEGWKPLFEEYDKRLEENKALV